MGRKWIPADTTPEAALVHEEVFRRMAPSRRLELALEMSDEILAVSAAATRSTPRTRSGSPSFACAWARTCSTGFTRGWTCGRDPVDAALDLWSAAARRRFG